VKIQRKSEEKIIYTLDFVILMWQIKGVFVFGFVVCGSLFAQHLFSDESAVFAHARVCARLPRDFVLFAFTTFTRELGDHPKTGLNGDCCSMSIY
jgi:hypothetical protein